MKPLFLLVTILISVTHIFSQTKIPILESTKKIPPLSEEVIFFGLKEGDKLIINIEEQELKELKEIELLEYPSNSKFMDYKTPRIDNKSITITKTGIYKLRLQNSSIGARICRVLLERIPLVNNDSFNTSVYWKTITDTTYYDEEETFISKRDTTYTSVYEAFPKLGSVNSLEGLSTSQTFEFTLPENTVSWAFYIGTGNESKSEFSRAREQLISQPSYKALNKPTMGPLSYLAEYGTSNFKKITTTDNVNYLLLPTNQVPLKTAGQAYDYYYKGDVFNDFQQVKSGKQRQMTMIVKNDNTIDPIYVYLRVAAFIITPTYSTRIVKKQKITSTETPYLIN